MEHLNDFQNAEGGRDICHFQRFESSKERTTFAAEALSEIPEQLTTYFLNRNIFPMVPDESETIDIPIDEMDNLNIEPSLRHSFESESETT